MPEEPVVLDGVELVKSFRNSRRGAASCPSGCVQNTRGLFFHRKSDVMDCASRVGKHGS